MQAKLSKPEALKPQTLSRKHQLLVPVLCSRGLASTLPLVSRECTPFLHSLLTKGKPPVFLGLHPRLGGSTLPPGLAGLGLSLATGEVSRFAAIELGALGM